MAWQDMKNNQNKKKKKNFYIQFFIGDPQRETMEWVSIYNMYAADRSRTINHKLKQYES